MAVPWEVWEAVVTKHEMSLWTDQTRVRHCGTKQRFAQEKSENGHSGITSHSLYVRCPSRCRERHSVSTVGTATLHEQFHLSTLNKLRLVQSHDFIFHPHVRPLTASASASFVRCTNTIKRQSQPLKQDESNAIGFANVSK
jgi:hypothetical protein